MAKRLSIAENESRLMRALQVTHCCEVSDLATKYGVTAARLKTLVKNKYIEVTPTHASLGAYGKGYCREEFGDWFYKAASSAHDSHLNRQVQDLTDKELESVVSPQEFLKEQGLYYKDDLKIGTPDLLYQSEETGEWVVVEVITQNYKKIEIERKLEWASKVGVTLNLVKNWGE